MENGFVDTLISDIWSPGLWWRNSYCAKPPLCGHWCSGPGKWVPLQSYFLWGIRRLVVVQSLSCVRLSAARWTAACQASLSFTISVSLLRLMSIESVMPSNHLIFCRPLLLLPSVFPSIRVFSKESALHIRWPKYWIFSISPSNEYSGFPLLLTGLISLQSKGLSSLLQHYSLKASVLWCSAFFMVQCSHLYIIMGKTIVLTIRTFVSKVMSLLFNILSRLS